MPLIVCTEILCFAQSRLQFQAFTGSAISAITNLQSSGLRTEYCCHRKAHIKAIRWAHSYSASPSIHPDILRLQSELVAGFMGDLTVGGPTDTVAADIDYIRDREQRTGLRINASKSEIICSGSTLGQYSSTSSSLWHLTRQIIWVPHFSQAKDGHSSGQPLH